MDNQNIEAAQVYHNATKHSYWSIRNNPHFLDWANQPIPFKIYTKLEPILLSKRLAPTKMTALEAISVANVPAEETCLPNLSDITRILYFSAGVTKHKKYPGGEIYFRAAACTGALYETELYLVCGNLPDLEAGIYHFSVHDFALRQLRQGDYRGVLVHATAEELAVARAPAMVVCTGTYWRNAWKYQARTYRHFFWDSGTMLANFQAVAAALGVPTRVVMGFVDEEVNRLIDLDPQREVALWLAPLGRRARPRHPQLS
jgi:SagB-type dehydrogenase family enzyme